MIAVKRILIPFFVVALCLGFVCTACGGEGGENRETIFVYIVNGYPGTSSMTLYGPTGKLVSGLAFSERTPEPIEVNRNVNADDFLLVFDGAPTPIEASHPMFSLYPQETGTLVISRRAGEASADTTLYRHTRSPDPTCLITFGNSLSLDNGLLTDDFISYSYQTEWRLDSYAQHYDQAAEGTASTRCGQTEVPSSYQRPDIHSQIDNDPWFFPVVSTETAGAYMMVWAQRFPDPRTGEARSEGIRINGTIEGARPTENFVECLSSAVSVVQEEDSDDACPAPTGPNNQLGTDQVTWNDEAARACLEAGQFTGFPVEPGQPDQYQAFTMFPRSDAGAESCGFPVRIRTPSMDLIFQNIDRTVPNFIDNEGGFVQVDATFPASENHFFVLFGRPINPFVEQWNSEETAVPLNDYPYPGDVVPSYAGN